MTPGWLALVAVVALALASVSVRSFVDLAGPQRLHRAIVIAVTVALAVVLVGEFLGWEYWPPGVVVGLAVVELGPVVASTARALIKRKGGDL